MDLLGLSLCINFLKLVKNQFKIELQLDRLAKYSRGVKTDKQFIMYNIIVIIKLQLLQASTALRKKYKKQQKSFHCWDLNPDSIIIKNCQCATADFIYISHRFFFYLMLFQQAEKQSENFHFKWITN